MTPAVAFTLTVSNPSTEHAIEASLLLSMPLAAQPATARIDDTGAPRTPDPAGTTPMLCKAGCDAAAACRAWSFDAAVPPAAGCALISGGVPLNVYSASVTSGIKGTWAGDSAAGTLTHDRAAVSPPLPPSPGARTRAAARLQHRGTRGRRRHRRRRQARHRGGRRRPRRDRGVRSAVVCFFCGNFDYFSAFLACISALPCAAPHAPHAP